MRLFLLLSVFFSLSFLTSYAFAQEQANGGREHRDESGTSAQSEGDCHSISDIELDTVTAALPSNVSPPSRLIRPRAGQGVE